MTCQLPSDSSSSEPFSAHQCFWSGRWCRYGELAIPPDDLGFRQGVTAVERLRTYGGKPFEVARHLARFGHSLRVLQIEDVLESRCLEQLINEALDRNRCLLGQLGELGITLLATPGVAALAQPTLVIHLNQIDLPAVARRQRDGQPVCISNFQTPPAETWPPSIKVRARIHYYLADLAARRLDANAIAILTDANGQITESSVANVAMVHNAIVHSPPSGEVLGGVTQAVVESLARQSGLGWKKRSIPSQELCGADEVLLMGTDGGLWFASSVDGQAIGGGKPGPVYRQLQSQFQAYARQHAR